MSELQKLPGLLLPWFEQNKRNLPWRENRDPYRVWLSEIMLQQTRVEAVKGYYASFLEALPTVQALADCPEEQLLKLWEGLGYYNRARNLQKAAKILAETGFPDSYEGWLSLPGVENIPPVRWLPSALTGRWRRWTATCCGCCPAIAPMPVLSPILL